MLLRRVWRVRLVPWSRSPCGLPYELGHEKVAHVFVEFHRVENPAVLELELLKLEGEIAGGQSAIQTHENLPLRRLTPVEVVWRSSAIHPCIIGRSDGCAGAG